MNAKQGWIDITTGAVNTTFTATIGFQPKFVFLWWNGRTENTDTVGGADHHRGYGVFTGTGARYCIDTRSLDAQASSVGSSYIHNAAAVIAHTDTTLDGIIDVDAILSDGFRLIVDDVMPYALRVGYLALGGSDVANAAVGTVAADATGRFILSGLGWQPNFAMLIGNSAFTSAPGGSATNSTVGIGIATSSTNQVTLINGEDDASATMDTASYCTDNNFIAHMIASVGTTISGRNDFSTFDSGGFTTVVDTTGFAQNTLLIYAVLSCTNVIVGNSATRTDGNDITISGLGWKPAAGIVISHGDSETTTTTMTRNDMSSIGAFTSASERGALGVMDVDNIADSQVTTAIEHDAVYINLNTSDAVEGLMDVKSVDSGGVTFVMDDTDPAAEYFGYVLFGPAGGTTHEASATLSGSGSLSAVPNCDRNGAAALAGSASIVPAGSKLMVATSALNATGTVAAVGSYQREGAATLAAAGSLAAVPNCDRNAATTLSGSATLAAVPNCIRDALATLAGTGTLAAVGTVSGTIDGSAALSSSATLAAVPNCDRNGTALLAGTGSISAVATIGGMQEGAATLTASATVSAVPNCLRDATALLSGVGGIVPAGSKLMVATSALNASGSLAGVPTCDRNATTTLAGSATLAAVPNCLRNATTTLSGVGSLAAVGNYLYSGAALLSGTGTVVPVGVVTMVAAALLAGTGALTAVPTMGPPATNFSQRRVLVAAESRKVEVEIEGRKVLVPYSLGRKIEIDKE